MDTPSIRSDIPKLASTAEPIRAKKSTEEITRGLNNACTVAGSLAKGVRLVNRGGKHSAISQVTKNILGASNFSGSVLSNVNFLFDVRSVVVAGAMIGKSSYQLLQKTKTLTFEEKASAKKNLKKGADLFAPSALSVTAGACGITLFMRSKHWISLAGQAAFALGILGGVACLVSGVYYLGKSIYQYVHNKRQPVKKLTPEQIEQKQKKMAHKRKQAMLSLVQSVCAIASAVLFLSAAIAPPLLLIALALLPASIGVYKAFFMKGVPKDQKTAFPPPKVNASEHPATLKPQLSS